MLLKFPDLKKKISPRHSKLQVKNPHFNNYIGISFVHYTKPSVPFLILS